MQKTFEFYQHEQKDFVNHSYRIVLLMSNSASIDCVNDFVVIMTICILTFNWIFFIHLCLIQQFTAARWNKLIGT